MSGHVLPVTELFDMQQTAQDLQACFELSVNDDIGKDFPGTLGSFRTGSYAICDLLRERVAPHEAGERQLYISYAAEGDSSVAMGVSWIRVSPEDAPEGIDPNIANVSLVMCHPYRGRGIGALTLRRQLQAVDENFEGLAWTSVRTANHPSRQLVEKFGFSFLYTSVIEGVAKRHYLYDAETVRKNRA